MVSQGIELPVSVQIKNLQEIANQLKQFANKNILSDSLGGKKIDQELAKVLNRLDQIQAKAKTALTTQGDFSSIQKDIDQVELGLNRVSNATKNLSFADLKIPDDVRGQIEALQARIRELQNSLTSFKGTQKEKLVNNQDFLANLKVAEPGQAAKMLEKGYDDLYKAVQIGMGKVNQELAMATAEYNRQQNLLTQNSDKEKFVTQWGAIDYLSQAFKTVAKNGQQNDIQKSLSGMLNFTDGEFTGFTQGGAPGIRKFLNTLKESYAFTDQDIADIQKRLREQAATLKTTQTEVFKSLGDNPELAKNILFGDKASFVSSQTEMIAQIKAARDAAQAEMDKWTTRQTAYSDVSKAFDLPNEEIKAKAKEIAEALKEPQAQLESYQNTLLSAVASSPELASIFGQAAHEISTLSNAVEAGKAKLQSLDEAISKMQGISNFVNRYIGLYAIVRKVTTAVKNAFNNIKELDKVITNIAVVTNMSQQDLWGKIGEYTSMAQQYGVATKDVYTVSQIFYQQGLQTSQVMSLTTETLKMAKISGMEYSEAANAMTVAIRAYKIEMTDAQQVTDTYSALAAKFAVSSAEIANAMEKTASSAANVGMSLQSTSAFISVMTQTTRESAQNIGSALKSIISRYGEMKASPAKLLNVDGEEVAFNKVDTALSSIGISIKDASGQFRDFDDVIMDLAAKWDSLDNNTQRYIATIMAGNRQQSRFIALVSNYDELNRAMNVASTAENASIVQTAKTLDSLESKANQLKNAFSQLYLDLHIEDGLKGAYEWLTRIVTTIGKLGTLNGVLPTLMNIIGFGSGTKSLLSMGKNWLTNKKTTIQLETDQYDKKIEEIKQDVQKKVEIVVDSSKYQQELDRINAVNEANKAANAAATAAAQPTANTQATNMALNNQIESLSRRLALTGISTDNARNQLTTALSGSQFLDENGQVSDKNILAFMDKLKIDPETEYGNSIFQSLTELATAAQNASSGLNEVGTSGENAAQGAEAMAEAEGENTTATEGNTTSTTTNTTETESNTTATGTNTTATDGATQAEEEIPPAANEVVQAAGEQARAEETEAQASTQNAAQKDVEANSSTNVSAAKTTEANASQQVTLADLEQALNELDAAKAAQAAALADQQKAQAAVDAGHADQEATLLTKDRALAEANAALESAQSKYDETYASYEAAAADREEAGASREAANGKYNSGLMKGIGVATGVARIAGTAITAAGAAHQDKSTDAVETSKILTGLGNGMSMAGTGASMGMAFGPVGAAIGAFGGFLIGGFGAIIDGVTMTLAEKLKLQEQEVEAAKNESLKASAKVTDLSSTVDNLKNLQKAMYNSSDDMQAYKDAMNTMASQYPSLVSAYDEAGNAIIDIENAEALLLSTRANSAAVARKAAEAEVEKANSELQAYDKLLAASSGAYTDTSMRDNGAFLRGDVVVSTTRVLDEGEIVSIESGRNETSGAYQNNQRYYDFLMAAFDSLENLPAELSELQKYKNNPNLMWDRADLTTLAHYVHDNSDKQSFAAYGYGYYPTFNGVKWQDYGLGGQVYSKYQLTDLENYIDLLESGETVTPDEIDLTAEVDPSALATLNELVYEYRDLLELDSTATKENAAYKRFGWSDDKKVTYGDLQQAYSFIENLSTQKKNQRKALLQTAGLNHADTMLQNGLLGTNDISSENKMTISGNNVFRSILYQSMENAAEEAGFDSLADMKVRDEDAYNKLSQDTTNSIIEWLSGLTESQLDEFIKATSDLTIYRNADDMLKATGISADTDVGKALIQQFADSNKANRDRILKTVYATDEFGEVSFNAKGLTGITKLANGESFARNIADMFQEDAPLIATKYADFFASQLASINTLADQGYTTLASSRLEILNSLANTLSKIEDSTIQNDLYNTITGINFNDYDSIKNGIKSIETYANKNSIDLEGDNEIAEIYKTLTDAAGKLIYNVNTLAQTLTTNITETAKDIDTLLTTNKSGLTLDKALESLKTINATSTDELGFDQVFTYDAALGKYVYSAQGLAAALEGKEKILQENAEKLLEAAGLAEDAFLSIEDSTGRNAGVVYTEAQQLVDAAKDIYGDEDWNDQIAMYYEQLAADFMKSTDYTEKTWANFVAYTQKQVEAGQLSAEEAQAIYDAYEANKANQYYQSIDWSKLMLGTDTTGSNKNLMMHLAKELKMAEYDAENQVWTWLDGQEHTWEEVQDAYLDQLYGTDETAKAAAKAAIKGQQKKDMSDQVSNAITEMLAGEGQVLSDTTTALLSKTEGLNVPVDGVLSAADDYINSAIKLYNEHSKNLLSVAAKNEAYASILTKQAEQNNQVISTLSSGASLDISALSQTFTTFGLTLSDYYDESAAKIEDVWKGGNNKKNTFANAFKTDMFGKTQITDWDEFLKGIGDKIDVSELKKTFDYKNAYSAYVDGLITLDTQERDLIKKSYDNAFSSITAWKPMNVSMIENDARFNQLINESGSAIIENGQLTILNAVQYARDISEYLVDLTTMSEQELYETSGLTRADLAKDWKNAQTVITQVQDAWTGISENISALTTDQISTLVEKGDFNLKNLDNEDIFKKIGDTYALNLDAYRQLLIHYIGDGQQSYEELSADQKAKVDEAYNKAAQAIVNKITGLDWTKMLDGTATAADQDAFKSGLGEALASLGTDIAGFYNDEGQFDYQGLIADLNQQVDLGVLDAEIAEQIINNILNTVASVRDTALEEISSSMNLLSSGTTSQAEMTKFVQRYNKLTGENKGIDDLFNYNELTQTYTLTSEAIKAYYEAQKKLLANIGMTDAAVQQYILDQVQQTIGAEMDISGFLSGTDISSNGKAAQTLMSQISNWYAAQSETLTDIELDVIMQTLVKGGDEAVKKLKEFKGESNVSSDEIQAVYKAQINRLNDALDQVSNGLEKGAVVTGELATLLQKVGYSSSLKGLGDGTYVVDAVINMVDAYGAIYLQMKNTAEATQSELNAAYAKLLTASEQGNIDAISALGDAMGMSYDQLGTLLAQYGKEGWKSLEYVMENQLDAGIQQLGNGTIKIVDFTKFASHMNWEVGGAEYVKALEEYNDSLISDMTENAESVVEEITSLTEARAGQKINFTRIQAALNMSDDAFNDYFGEYGVKIKNGILEITSTAKLPELTQKITQTVSNAANLIPSQIAEIKDAVVEALQAIAELIQSGISGSLSHVDALSLQQWGSEHGLNNLNFTETSEGLKLSQKSAISLYNTLKDIDSIQAELVFDELSESLESTNEHYRDVTGVMQRISELNDLIADPKTSDARKKQYEEELAVAKEILAVRSTAEDSSFNFMSNEIPGGQNNPINYAENWGKAWATLRDAFSATGKDKAKIEYEDFYNIMTEMGRIAEVSGQPIKIGADKFVTDAESAAELIEEGASCLSVAADGTVKVDLSKFGMDFSSGANDMASNINDGIDAIADSQIEMLDSMIALLEVVVAMEQLGDIDVNGDNHLNLDEIFVIDGEGNIEGADGLIHFTEQYKQVAQNILTMAETDEDLDAALNSVRVNNHTMKEILQDATDGVLDLEIDAEVYRDALNAFYQMAISGDYDLDNVVASIQKIMDASGLKNITVDVGDKTFQITGGNKFVFDWSDEAATKAAADAITAQGSEFISKWNLGDKPTIKERLLELANKLEDPNLSIEDRAELQYILRLGTGEIKIEEVEGKPGTYTGTYKGRTVTGSKENVEAAIQKAIRYEEDGFTFEFTDTGDVKGSAKIGNTTIEITGEGEDVTYKTQWGEFKTKDEAIRDCVAHGYADATMDNYVYEGGNLEVKYNEALGIGFVYSHSENAFYYEGKKFLTIDAMYEYIDALATVSAEKWTTYESTNKKGQKLEVKKYGEAKVTHNLETGETTYESDGVTFKSAKAFAEWLAAKELATGQGTGEVITTDDGHKQLNFKLSGKEVTLDIDAEGTTKYSFTIGGETFESDTEAGIKQAIADHDWLTDPNATVEGGETVSYKVTGNSGTLTVEYNGDKVTVTGDNTEAAAELEQKLTTKLQAQVDETKPKAEVKNAELTLGEGSEVKLAEGEEGKVPELLMDSVTIKPTEINVSLGEGITPQFANGENTTPDMPIDSLTVKPATLNVDASTAGTPQFVSGETVTPEMPIDKVTLQPGSLEVDATAKAVIAEGSVVSLKDEVAVIGDASGLTVNLAEGTDISLAGQEEDKIDLDYIGTATGEVDGIEVTVGEAAINTLAEGSVVKIKDKVAALADASGLEVKIDEGTHITPATMAEDTKLDIGGLGDVTGGADTLEVEVGEGTSKVLSEGTVVHIDDAVSTLADASALTISLAEGCFIGLTAKETDDGYDVGGIGDITGAADKFTISLDSTTNIGLAANSVVSLTNAVSALANASALLVSLSEGAFISLNLGEGTEQVDVGGIPTAVAAVDNLVIESYDNIQTPDEINGTATITAEVQDNASEKLTAIKEKSDDVDVADPNVDVSEKGSADVKNKLIQVANAARSIPTARNTTVTLKLPSGYESLIDAFINKIKQVAKTWTVTFKATKTGNWPSDVSGTPWARGNVGPAKAGGSTLMGELGPELVVQNGRYFVAGQNGAEFVDLAQDAIVFNHLQTEQLLKNGMSSERGRAVTNERVAASYAKGNVNGGPAMASASAALAALKQLRAQWQALKDMSVKDLAGKAGGGGGGSDSTAAFIKDLERWYNLLQDIATLEEQITYQETLRSKLASDFNTNGKAYYESQKESLKNLQAQVAAHKQLAEEQEAYFKRRQDELNHQSAFSELYTFDENGQIKYKEGKFAELSKVFGADSTTGKPNNSVEEQYNWLISQGYGYAMQYDDEGNEIDTSDDEGKQKAIQAFWDKIEADKEEMQDLHDSIEEHREAMLEAQQKQNEIMKAIEDNQIAVEDRVLAAVEDARQREIDELQDQTDAIKESSQALIDGLTNQLEKERTMYDNQSSATDLETNRRKLAILQRSGGSAAEINSLQAEIDDQAKELYFAKQQEQIDAIQAASDAEIEKLEAQIDLMEETLEYEKEHGLLWGEVKEIMKGTPEEITQYITSHDSSYWGKSVTKLEQESRQIKFEAEQWAAFRDDGKSIAEILSEISANTSSSSSASSGSSSGSGSGSGGSGGSSSSGSGSSSSSGGGGSSGGGRKPSSGTTTCKHNQTRWVEAANGYRWDKVCVNCGAVLGHTYTNPNSSRTSSSSSSSGRRTGGGCFVAGSQITMADGTYKNIEDVLSGELIRAYDEVSESFVNARVNMAYPHFNTPQVLEIKLSDGTTLGITPGHPILTTNGWKSRDIENSLWEHGTVATLLEVGDEVIGINENAFVEEIDELDIPENYTTYNLEVDIYHTYIVDGIVVHNAVSKYAGGGMNYQTGEAILHGTKTKPEAVLNAEQTRVLRDNILSNKKNSLVSLLKTYNDSYDSINSNINDVQTNSDNSVTFEHAEVNVRVEKLANGYDASRAGDDIMKEMLKIASKAKSNNKRG